MSILKNRKTGGVGIGEYFEQDVIGCLARGVTTHTSRQVVKDGHRTYGT